MINARIEEYKSKALTLMEENNLDLNIWDFRISCAPSIYKPTFTWVAFAHRGDFSLTEKYNEPHLGLTFEYLLLNNYGEWFHNIMLHEITHAKVFERQAKYYMPKDEETDHGQLFMEEGAKLIDDPAKLLKTSEKLISPMHSWLAFCRYCDKDFYVNELTLERLEIRCKNCRGKYPDAYYSWVKTIYFIKETLTKDIRRNASSGIWRPKMNVSYEVDWLDLGYVNENVFLENINLNIENI